MLVSTEWMGPLEEVGKGILLIGGSLAGGTGVWKLVDKLIDVSEARRKAREDAEKEDADALRKERDDAIKKVDEIQDKLLRLSAEAAGADYWKRLAEDAQKQRDDANTRTLETERKMAAKDLAHKSELFRLDGELRQKEASLGFYRRIAQVMSDQEGIDYLRRKGLMNP